jgi:hypothetical protein
MYINNKMEIPKRENYNSTYDWVKAFEELPFYGWYSNKEYKERGASIWSTRNNDEIEVTHVTRINKPPSDNHVFINLLEGYKRRTINYN